jgi:hypothetical protein
MGRTELKGFRAYMPNGESYGYIAFYKWALVLRQTNTRRVKCIYCQGRIEAGEGVYHRMYQDNGYVHLNCAKMMILQHGKEQGYTENILSNLQCCFYSTGKFTAQEVCEGIRRITTLTPAPLPQGERVGVPA